MNLKRVLMGPGPSDVDPRVLEALSRPTIGHLDPVFMEMLNEIRELLQYTFQTRNELTLAMSGTGSAGMETCIVNLVEPGDSMLVCINGVFGGRMADEVVERQVVHADWRGVLMVGVLGAFTTFSTFSLETIGLLEAGHALHALAYMLGSTLLCVLMAGAAVQLTRLLV